MDDRIEQQITINAPLDRVWELVTQPGWWVPSEVDHPANRSAGGHTVRESAKWGRFVIETVRIEPKSYAAFRWAWAEQFRGTDELAPGTTTLVEFSVTPTDDAVTVSVTESGFASLAASDEVRLSGFQENTTGWGLELNSLRERAEADGVR
jgi:uncharacterized protein YndB with AHSA1/START domain